MSASNFRIKEFNTVHHLVSRIAHKVFFLGDDERNDLIEIVRRAASFSGLQLLGWCVMTNHFHLLVHLPERCEISDDEVLQRVGVLKGDLGLNAIKAQLAQWDEARVKEWYDRQRARMYDVGEFMKIVKQWFTEDYNNRHSHVGTLWESVYHDHVVPVMVKDMSRVLAYIHLNPIRAAACVGFTDYVWSSFAALAKGDDVALSGIRFVYDVPSASADELISRHSELLEAILEGVKRQRAMEIAQKRAAGFNVAVDPLTNEALVAQAAAQLDEIQRAAIALKHDDIGHRVYRTQAELERDLLAFIAANPMADAATIANKLSLKPSRVYDSLRSLKNAGVITRFKRNAPWIITAISKS